MITSKVDKGKLEVDEDVVVVDEFDNDDDREDDKADDFFICS